jgi:hypothetical protein
MSRNLISDEQTFSHHISDRNARDFLRCIRSVEMRDGIFTHDYKTEKAKMILNDKQDCIDSIARVLNRTSVWRKAIA